MMGFLRVQEDLPELYEDGNARWLLLHLLRTDNARQLPPAAREVLQPPAKARLVEDASAVSPPAADDGIQASADRAQMLVSFRLDHLSQAGFRACMHRIPA